MYVCICKAVTEQQVRRAVESGMCSPADLVAALELDDPSNCGRCVTRAERLLALPCVQQALAATPMVEASQPSMAV